jgi:hypothetical protein
MVRQAPTAVTTAPKRAGARNARKRKRRNTSFLRVVRNVGGATDIKTVKTVKIHIARDIERGASDRAAMTEKSAAATKIGKTRKAIVKVETSVKPAEMTIIGLIENIKLERPVLIETRAVEGGEKEVTAARTVAKERHVAIVLIAAVNTAMVGNIDADEVTATTAIATPRVFAAKEAEVARGELMSKGGH